MRRIACAFVLSIVFFLPIQFVLAEEASSTPEMATSTDEIIDTETSTSTPEVVETDTSTATDETASTSSPQAATSTDETASSTSLIIESHVDVPFTCTVTDTDGIAHTYPEATSTISYLAICAIKAALEGGIITGIGLSNAFPTFGLFVTEINAVAADPSSEYWALYQNGSFASLGLTSLPVVAGDSIELQRHDFSDNDLGDRLTLHIASLIATSSATSTASTSSPQAATTTPTETSSDDTSSGGGPSTSSGRAGGDDTFDIEAALAYLAAHQNEDGSFDSDMLTDWAAIAFAAKNPGSAKTKLKAFLRANSPSLHTVTDYERRAMALAALGINPYTGTGVDYIAPIVAAFDGTQVGDSGLDNDDIFALFPLLHAGYDADDEIIKQTVAFVVSKQKGNGSWDESVDVTAAAIQALTSVSALPNVQPAIDRGETYLRGEQKSSGGWENSFSTSWALQAVAALGQSPVDWKQGGTTPHEFLASLQQSDGGMDGVDTSENMRIWATNYAIPAALGKDWDSLFSSFSKPASIQGAPGEVAGAATTTSPIATSTISFATSTLTAEVIATTSPVAAIAPVPPPPPPKPAIVAQHSAREETEASSTSRQPEPQAQTAAVANAPNIFIRIWNFLLHLIGL